MEQTALRQLLTALIATWENEVVEFKQAGHDYNIDAIGEYFSAPSNDADVLGKLRRRGTIENVGSDAAPRWRLAARN